MSKKERGNRWPVARGWLFLLPGLFGFLLFFIWPFAISFGYSFFDQPLDSVFVGLENYRNLFQNESYLLGLKNTLLFIGICVPLNLIIALLLALMIKQTGRYQDVFTLIFLIPLVIPSGSMVFFWQALFADGGYLNYLLSLVGMGPANWLNSGLTRPVVIFIFMWKNLGYNIVLFIAGLRSIPRLYYEAAEMDGASPRRAFFTITVGNLTPTFVLVAIMSVINSFKVFKEIYLLTGSYPHEDIYMLQHFMNNMFSSLSYSKLTTATSMLVLLIAFLAWGMLRYERRNGL